jgi:hypothetical protein
LGLAAEVRGRTINRWTRPIVDELLGAEDARELDELLGDPSVVVQAIWLTLRARGIGVSEASVQKWAYAARKQ